MGRGIVHETHSYRFQLLRAAGNGLANDVLGLLHEGAIIDWRDKVRLAFHAPVAGVSCHFDYIISSQNKVHCSDAGIFHACVNFKYVCTLSRVLRRLTGLFE
jgi:hypothetical protein